MKYLWAKVKMVDFHVYQTVSVDFEASVKMLDGEFKVREIELQKVALNQDGIWYDLDMDLFQKHTTFIKQMMGDITKHLNDIQDKLPWESYEKDIRFEEETN